MKKSISLIFAIVVFAGYYFPVIAQDVNSSKIIQDSPVLFTPKNHDPNFLKSGNINIPEKSFYQRKSEWQQIIDSTWGPGDSLARKLEIFNAYANAIHDKSDVLCRLNLDWDSLYNHYLSQIKESTSKGAFSYIMSHFAYEMKDGHTMAYDKSVVKTALNPGIPVLILGRCITVEHFGAVSTVLPDSTNLILRVVPNHPLNIEPGDIILGYEGVPWKYLVKELLDAGLPFMAKTGGCKSADTYAHLCGAGLNWHLFNTIDILKYSTGDTVHLSVLPLLNLNVPIMVNNDQLPIQNIPFPLINLVTIEPYYIWDKDVTYGTLDNTNIGYIYLAAETSETDDAQLYEAINALKNTDALIIDMRYNMGGYELFKKSFDLLFNESQKTMEDAYRCNTSTFELCPGGNSGEWQINGGPPDYYDRPIAVLLGPQCISMGDITALRLKYHPMVRFFGKSSVAAHGTRITINNFEGWYLTYSRGDMFHVNEPGKYLNRTEFPIDYPVWFNKDDVAKGIDPVVEKSLEWINNLAYGHDISTEKGRYSLGNDTVKINAIIENPNSEVSARLIFEKIDGSVADSTEMVGSFLKSGFQWQAIWIAKNLPENNYWISLKVSDHTDGTSFTNKHMTRITNRPLTIGTLSYSEGSDNNYTIKTELKNSGESMNIIGPIIKITSDNPWIKSITPEQVTISGLKPGDLKRIPNSVVSVDEATFPGYVNLTYTISEDSWPYWVIDTTIYFVPTGLEQIESSLSFNLEQNYPNPFNSFTTINWQLSEKSKVTLKVLDIVGRTVASVVDEQRPQGKYETRFNAATLPKGIYFYQLKAGKNIQTRKMILLE